MEEPAEHPFAEYVRILGRGQHTQRSLTRDEAYAAFTQVMRGEVEDLQLGAFLMLLRVKGEDADELAGFAQAARDAIAAPELGVDIDWPAYAGKNRQPHWYLLAALLLAQQGHRIAMHSSSHPVPGRVSLAGVAAALGFPTCASINDIGQQLDARGLACTTLAALSPPLDRLFSFRPVLGVRSPVNSLVKLANPFRARVSLQGVFHPAYLELHQQAALRLGQARSLAMKGEGGEVEFRPDAENRLFLVAEGACRVEKWPRTQPGREPDVAAAAITATTLAAFWSGTTSNEYALSAVLGTAAMVLFAAGSAADAREAWGMARDYWQYRDKNYVARQMVS